MSIYLVWLAGLSLFLFGASSVGSFFCWAGSDLLVKDDDYLYNRWIGIQATLAK